MSSKLIKGQGAIQNIHNQYEQSAYVQTIYEDEIEETVQKTEYTEVFPKTILNDVRGKNVPIDYSLNPYQGCEHGCAYCYARSTHEYWGYSAGIDFERKIMVKKNAHQLLEKQFQKKNYKAHPFILSGNTDCYQPIERKLKITHQILQLCLDYRHPVGIITKNALILRDLDILKRLADKNLVNVAISIPTINESLRKKLEPRTSTVQNKLKTIKILSENNIPVKAMVAPIIPALNSDEILNLLKAVSKQGAIDFGYTLVRLNGTVEIVFKDWLQENFPDRAEKVLNQITSLQADERNVADIIHQIFKIGQKKYFQDKPKREKLATHLFNGKKGDQLSLF